MFDLPDSRRFIGRDLLSQNVGMIVAFIGALLVLSIVIGFFDIGFITRLLIFVPGFSRKPS